MKAVASFAAAFFEVITMKKMNPVQQILLTILGTMITAFAISVFLLPNKIVSGGVSGIATILYHTLHIPAGISNITINILLLLIGIKVLGKEFIVKTLIASGSLSLFIEIFSHVPSLTENVLLATLFGGILYGCGLGLAFIAGGSTGGTDILGRLLQAKFPAMPIGKLLMVVDGIVISSSLVVFRQTDLALFGILALFVNTFTIDWLIRRMNVSHLAFVISKEGRQISQQLVNTSPRGVTIIDATGAYTMEDTTLLVCALKASEANDFQKKILAIDPEAFVIFSQSQFIVGNGFLVYR